MNTKKILAVIALILAVLSIVNLGIGITAPFPILAVAVILLALSLII